MKTGMNLLLWSSNITEKDYPLLQKLKKMGFDGVEVPIFEGDSKQYKMLGKTLRDLGLEAIAVTVMSEETNPISTDKKVRKAATDRLKWVLERCTEFDAKILCGPLHSALGKFSGQGPTNQEWAWGVESMRTVSEHAEKCSVTLAVEYLNRFECYFLNNAADTAAFIEEVDHSHCRMMYDTFHANIEEKNISAAIRECSRNLVHVHISENDRSTPGRGNIPWKITFDTLSEIKYDGWLMIEAFGLALPHLAAATKIWRRMYENEEQLAKNGLAFMKANWTTIPASRDELLSARG